MAAKRPFADLDLTQEERRTTDSIRRSSYPAAFTTASVPLSSTERSIQQSTTASRSARTLPLPSPTWFSPNNSFPSPHVPPLWDLPGRQLVPHQSPIQASVVNPSIGDAPRGLQVDYGSLVKKDPCSPPPSGLDSDDAAAQSLVNERSRPDSEQQRLKSEIALLQLQTEDLQQQIDLFKHQATKKDAQYLQIIEQSKRREMQGLTDSRRWQEDRKQWADERQVLLQTIAGLNTKLGELVHHTDHSRNKTTTNTTEMPAHQESSLRALSTDIPSLTRKTTRQQNSAILSPEEEEEDERVDRRHPPLPPLGYGPSDSIFDSSHAETETETGTETPWSQLRHESGRLAEYSTRLVEIGRNIRLQLDRVNARNMDPMREEGG